MSLAQTAFEPYRENSTQEVRVVMKPRSVQRSRVLIVDDDAVNIELLSELLGSENIEVFTASDGAESLAKFAQIAPDLVLMDINMPVMTGLDACGRLKANPDTRLVPVVLITAQTAAEDRLRGILAGADDFLTKPIDRAQLIARVRSLISLKLYTDELERAETVLFALAKSIEGKDPYTQGHCERISYHSEQLAKRLDLSNDALSALRCAGTVHDIGKVAVPDAILLKPARLEPHEMEIMKTHPVVGEGICAPLKSFRNVLPIIRHHHEKMNGTGYPDGLKGEAIPVTARVLQIVDVYDALTTERPYKKAMPPAAALETMEKEVAMGWWDPHIFAEFSAMTRERSATA